MKTEKYIPTIEDIKQAEDNLTPEQKTQSDAHEEGFNLAKDKKEIVEEKFDTQPSTESFVDYKTAEANGKGKNLPENYRFDNSSPLTPAFYFYPRTDGNYEVHINQGRFISVTHEGRGGLLDIFDGLNPMKTDELYASKIPAVIKLNADGSYKVVSKGEVKQL